VTEDELRRWVAEIEAERDRLRGEAVMLRRKLAAARLLAHLRVLADAEAVQMLGVVCPGPALPEES
jgi:hypothetical protein